MTEEFPNWECSIQILCYNKYYRYSSLAGFTTQVLLWNLLPSTSTCQVQHKDPEQISVSSHLSGTHASPANNLKTDKYQIENPFPITSDIVANFQNLKHIIRAPES